MSSKSESVRVCVRIRPLSTKEVQDGRTYIVHASPAQGEISLSNPEADAREPPKKFTFDAAIPPENSQQDVYAQAATDIVESVVNGFNGTIFAYGQTGAGKSHTMEGYSEPPEAKGIIPNSFSHIFDRIAAEADNKQFMVYASYLEIYNEEIRDLLAPDPKNRLELKETVDAGVFVKDLTSRQVAAAAEIDAVMQQGKKNRSVGATLMNQTSSRSHSMFTITVEALSVAQSEANGKPHICVGKLNLVDLAGSERQAKTGATGDRMKEATKINLSLSALGNVISALVDGKSQHIPYRDSKLTRLLQDSLGGNAKTVMIANCGPADYNYNETLSTLRYANRAKNIKNKPKINEDPKDAKIREYQEKIKELREALAAQEKNGPVASGAEGKAFSKDGGSAVVPQIVERIVEKTVVKREGVSEEVLRKLEEDARREKRELKQKAQEEMKALLAAQSRTEEERDQLERELQSQAQQKEVMSKQKDEMVSQLEALEHKLISGGRVLDKAAKQERQLREAQARVEAQKRQELQLARELAEKEDSNVLLEEQYTTLQDAVDDKTKKLKKLWAKHKAATTEIEDLKVEFQAEKEDMLDTVRELTRQLKLKHLLLSHFVPLDEAQSLEKRARYDADHDAWQVSRLETKPSSLRPKRPISRRGARRIESEYARRNRLIDPLNVRWRSDNVVQLDLEMPERRTRDFEPANGAGCAISMDYWLERVGVASENDVEIMFANEVEVAPSKEKYPSASNGGSKESKDGAKKVPSSSGADDKSKKSATKRPATASRRRREAKDE
ncbi:kinesin-like protein [Phytophthora infestans T30-4]|uniref:Kinesin-like protein n=2 Tax=Phytophthora infestans TaxID=4787 RepID=D0NAN4_PHYIT|nr:kinesin-like protein [Phytophthora infestans T30-4]EEY54892.1 kinesin-like protein [Phytophthora infestans T30-4]KAF4041787.1 Kinesin motor domain [Phytophthora infestans]|eukprot:XP_002903837.1 kinesin-like protein [Phytophthora infestans T30-4]